MARSRVQLTLTGDGVSPDTVGVSDLGWVLNQAEAALRKHAEAEGIPLPDEALVSLVDVEESSDRLHLSIAGVLLPLYTALMNAVLTSDFSQIPREAHVEWHELTKRTSRKGWGVEFRDTADSTAVAAEVDRGNTLPEPPAPPLISGSTVMFGRCLRVGGVEPKAEIRPSQGGRLQYLRVSEEHAKELARRLYAEVELHGVATWRTDTWEMEEFKLDRIGDYQGTTLEESFRALSNASNGRWDGIDAAEYVDALRRESDDDEAKTG